MANSGRPKKSESVQINFRASKEMRDELEKIAADLNLNVSGLIRILIEDFLGQRDINGLIRENREQTHHAINGVIAARFLMTAANANVLLGKLGAVDFEARNRQAKALSDLNLDPVGLILHKSEAEPPKE
jgi:antitoxin component of RelBE/YafQ-DinJ toxin-antitoxin module